MTSHLTANPAYWFALVLTALTASLCYYAWALAASSLANVEYHEANIGLWRAHMQLEWQQERALKQMATTMRGLPGGME